MTTTDNTTDNTAVIRQLEREVESLEDRLSNETKARKDAQIIGKDLARQFERYGLMITYAMQGKRHPKEPDNDGRLDAVRAMAADSERVKDKYRTEQSLRAQAERHCDKLAAELAEMQRLYERATRLAMEAERRADGLLPETIGAEALE